jgi:hypothetical protein
MNSPRKRYRAFISYSRADKRIARQLHRAIERYRVPSGVDAAGIDPKTRRIGRFFRDEDEMGAATDLSDALRAALDDSENLIVLCSPHAAQSKWVCEEILHFKRTACANSIFAVVVAGEPNASVDSDPERRANECFPAPLHFEFDAKGQADD